jgi:xylulokinase
VGGGARSPLWNQIKADVLGRPVRVPKTAIGAPLGDAIIAAVGAGLYGSVEAAVARMVEQGVEYRPQPKDAARYDALYRIYVGLYPALKSSFHALAQTP